MEDGNTVILFLGDSITCSGRESNDSLGYGYVKKIAVSLNERYGELGAEVINRGISGDRVKDLKSRLTTDCTRLKPRFLTILVGINECMRRYDSNDETPLEIFEETYTYIISHIKKKLPNTEIILMEPFLIPLLKSQQLYRDDIDPKIHAVRRIAALYKCGLIPLDGVFAQAAVLKGCESLTYDGVHLYDEGHKIIADAWMSFFLERFIEPVK